MTKEELIDRTKAFLFDLDGTLYLDETPLPRAAETLEFLRGRGKKIVYLTNNSSKTQEEYREKLARIGFYEPGDLVYTSAMATVFLLKREYAGKRVFLMGTEKLRREFAESGILLTQTDPEVCVLAYDVEATFEKLCLFDKFLRSGAKFIATHPDDVCPTKEGSMPDVGSFLALFSRSAKRKPDRIVGKPYSEMAKGLCAELKLGAEEMCMVGDRMYTDIRFANRNKILSVLVLSGETSLSSMKEYPDTPDLVLESVADLRICKKCD